MAYCRWSSCNGYCDVYVYEDVEGGWTTHVATTRIPPGAPPNPYELLFAGDISGYHERNNERRAWVDSVERIRIDHPDAGKSFNHDTPRECAENLKRLKMEGIVVPDNAIRLLMEEARHEGCGGNIYGQVAGDTDWR